MSELLPIYAIFSITALVAKLAIAWFGRDIFTSENKWFAAFFVALFGINLLELVGFNYPSDGRFAMLMMTIYYQFVLVMGIAFWGTSLDATGWFARWTGKALCAMLLLVSVGLWWPGIIIADIASVGYTSTRVPGPLYWLFQVVLVGSLLGSIGTLAYHAKHNACVSTKRKAKALFISIMPIFVTALLVVALMQMGVKVTGSVFGSLAILTFLFIFIRTNDEHRLFTFLSYIPATSENKVVNNIRDAVCTLDIHGLQKTLYQFEATLIADALEKSGGNKTSAAEMLGISRTTLRRKINLSN